jgi:hypothetical protein
MDDISRRTKQASRSAPENRADQRKYPFVGWCHVSLLRVVSSAKTAFAWTVHGHRRVRPVVTVHGRGSCTTGSG